MGRHSQSHTRPHRSAVHVGRVGLLAVALGIGFGALTGTAVASADTTPSNASDGSPAQASVPSDANSTVADTDDAGADEAEVEAEVEVDADLEFDVEVEVEVEVEAEAEVDDEAEAEAEAEAGAEVEPDDESPSSLRLTENDAPDSDETVAPAPDDQADTEYGEIGKWMLERNGDIADYGGLPYDGRTVLEPVNVIIVDQTSRSSLEATWRLSAAMRRAGFPPRFFHSTGFRGLIDDVRYRQRPGGLLLGYSDDFFLLPNNHGRIFGPDPVETSTGYVWSGAFSTEEFTFYQGLPRHAYVSSNEARDALAGDFVASGRATLGGMVALDNVFETDAITTGDHDGYAVVIILGSSGAPAQALAVVDRRVTESSRCVATRTSATPDPGCPSVGAATAPVR